MAGQVRTEQWLGCLWEIQLSFLPRLGWPEALLESWGWSSRIRSQAGTWARQTVHSNVTWEIFKKLRPVRGTSRMSRWRVLRTLPSPGPSLDRRQTGFSPGGFLAVCWWVTAAQSCFFYISLLSLLVSSVKSWLLEILKASSIKLTVGFQAQPRAFVVFSGCQE